MDSQNVPTQIHNFERQLCAQIQELYIVETFYMSHMNPKEFVHYTAHSILSSNPTALCKFALSPSQMQGFQLIVA